MLHVFLDTQPLHLVGFLHDTACAIHALLEVIIVGTQSIEVVAYLVGTLQEESYTLQGSYDEKNHQLFLHQKKTLDTFLEHGAISQAQHDKSLHDLIEKMGKAAESGEPV